MNGLDINSTPFKHEVAAVVDRGVTTPCYHYTLEFHVNGQNYTPFSIVSVSRKSNFLRDFYQILDVEFQTTAYIKEQLIEHMSAIEVTFKSYEIARNIPYSEGNIKNPKIRRCKAKLYVAESEFIKQENPAANNADYMRNKSMTHVKLQLVEKGFEDLKMRYVGGPYRDVTGGELIRHLIDFHANRDNDDVNSLINGVDFAPGESDQRHSQLVLSHGISLIEAMHHINQNSGGIYPTGFSYFIHNNIWYVFPPYALNRFKQNTRKLIIVNLPKDRLPTLEKTYTDDGMTVIMVSTRGSTSKDQRESKKVDQGVGVRFADAAKMMTDFATSIGNKLSVKRSDNVNDLITETRSDGQNLMKFGENKVTSSKNLELSKLAPAKGFMMQIPWENPNESIITPGMPVKVLYLKNNQTAAAEGVVLGIKCEYYPYEASFPAMKFAGLAFIDVFVSDVNYEG